MRTPGPAVAFLLAACRAAPAPSDAERTTPEPEAGAAEAPAATATAPTARLRACRVIKRIGLADGGAGRGSAVPALGELLPETRLELMQDEGLVVKSTVSGRELGLDGPLLAEVCPEGEEEVRLSFGSVRGFAGAGVRPGAEVWIATPLGVVRFNEANLKVEVAPAAERLSVTVTAGRAVFLAAKEPRGDAGIEERTVAAGVPFVLTRPAGPVSRLARELASSCARQADVVEEMARALFHADAGELGARAAKHVGARRLAWALCSSARAAAALDEEREGPLLADIEKAEEKWKRLTRSPVRR